MTRRRKLAIELLSDIGVAAHDLQTYSDPDIADALAFMRQANGPLFDWLLKALTPAAPADAEAPLVTGGSTGLDGWIREPSANDAEAGRREAPTATCDSCQFHNTNGPLCKMDVSRPNRNGAQHNGRTIRWMFGCTLHTPGAPHGDGQAGTAAERK